MNRQTLSGSNKNPIRSESPKPVKKRSKSRSPSRTRNPAEDKDRESSSRKSPARKVRKDAEMASINDLPDEILEQIFLYLGRRDLMSCTCVSLRWREVINRNIFWTEQCSIARIRYKETLQTSCTLNPNTARLYREAALPPKSRLTEWCHWRSQLIRYQFLKRNWQKGDFSLKKIEVDARMYAGGFLIDFVDRGLVVHSVHDLDAPLLIMKQYSSMNVDAVEVKGNLLFYSQNNHLICTKWENMTFTNQYEIAVPNQQNKNCITSRPELALKITDQFLVVQDVLSACFLYFHNYKTGKLLRTVKLHPHTINQCVAFVDLEARDNKVVFVCKLNHYHLRVYDFKAAGILFHMESLKRPYEPMVAKNFFGYKIGFGNEDEACVLQVWSIRTGEGVGMHATLKCHPVLLTDNDRLIYTNDNDTLVVNLANLEDIAQIDVGGPMLNMATVWDNFLVTNARGCLQLWDLLTGIHLHTYLRETIDNMWVDDCRIVVKTSESPGGPTSGGYIIGYW